MKETKPTTAPRMFRAHLYGIALGSVLGIVLQALTKKYLIPRLGLEESPLEQLAGLVKNLPKPEADDAAEAPKAPSGFR